MGQKAYSGILQQASGHIMTADQLPIRKYTDWKCHWSSTDRSSFTLLTDYPSLQDQNNLKMAMLLV
jgi:hypothetical protein